jgi:Peptidase C39 family
MDLLPGIFLTLTLCVGGLLLGPIWSRGRSTRHRIAVVLICMAGIVVFRAWIEERLWVASIIPWSGALTMVALSPALACIAVGVGWEWLGPTRLRRSFISVALIFTALFASWRMLIERRAPTQYDYRSGGWVLQTTQASCSPSSAANLLKHYGIRVVEAEMVDRCLTTSRGTTRLGLYRGLKRTLAGTPFDVRPFWPTTEELLSRSEPAIIFVMLNSSEGIDPRYVRDWGWRVGLKHVVVLTGREGPDHVRVIDPAVGEEVWEIASLNLLFQGEAVEIVKRAN